MISEDDVEAHYFLYGVDDHLINFCHANGQNSAPPIFLITWNSLDLCIMPTNLAGNAQCPRNNDDNAPAEKCVTK